MKLCQVSILALVAILLAVTTANAQVLQPSDVYVHYKFDETSGTAFVDSSPYGNNATFYSMLTYEELPAMDADSTCDSGAFGYSSLIGSATILGANKQVLVAVPVASHFPDASDTFAVSFWASVADWGGSDGVVASYNYNDIAWSFGMQSRTEVDGLVIETNSAGETGESLFVANCVSAGLTNNTFNHFVVQFDGTDGVSAVYINGAAVANTYDPETSVDGFWANEQEALSLGGRVLDCREYTPINEGTYLDDFAIISGTVTTGDVSNLYTSGASSLGSRRLLHLAMDDTSGSTVTDSSSYANHGALIANDIDTNVAAIHDVASATRTGQIGGAFELAKGYNQYGAMDTTGVDSMPITGEAFTVSFWLKPDEVLGWDYDGVISSWSNDDLGISISMMSVSTGTFGVRCTDGSYTGSSSLYGIHVGEGHLDLSTDEFHHFAVTVDENGDVTGVYIDGDYVASEYSNANGVTLPETSYIGLREHYSNPAGNYPLCAYLDDYAVVSGELTEAQIELAMASGVVALYEETDIPGDANRDGFVDGSDATILANYWQYGVGMTTPDATWEMGDFNGDHVVDGSDATLLASHWQEGTPPSSAVPEPSTLILVLCGVSFFCVLNRKKRILH